jgi:hypothetical protein
VNELNKHFARKLSVMVDSRLIWYKHYFKFCDEIIENMEDPPYWIIELATTKFIPDALKVINEYGFNSEPFEEIQSDLCDFFIACLFLRYNRREISWATFLKKSGEFADVTQAVKCDCEWFYEMLNNYEDSDFSKGLEKTQIKKVNEVFRISIEEAQELYSPFQLYFHEYVTNNNKNK